MESNTNFHQQVAWNCMNKYVGIVTTDGQSFDGCSAGIPFIRSTISLLGTARVI